MKTIKSDEGNFVEITLDIKHETEKAYLLSDGTKEAWTAKAKKSFGGKNER